MNSKEITGIILSGGRSKRLGEEKGLAIFQGKPLVGYAIEALSPVCSRILISANNDLEKYARYGYEVITDTIKGIGPMGGMISCLEQSTAEHNIVLSCDTPFVNGGLFMYLLNSVESYQAAVPVHDNFPEPLCAVYAREVTGPMKEVINQKNYKLQDFLQRIDVKKVVISRELPFFSGNLFANINSRNDLKKSYD
jgi:molybdopterin-guanine dinucleotide biosynthesis protein A